MAYGNEIVAYFTSGGVAATGLSPILDGWETDGSQVITSQTMTEIAGGYYKYTFSTYTPANNYCFRADGGATQPTSERYMFATNEVDQVSLGGGGGGTKVMAFGNKSPWTHKQRDRILKDTKETRKMLKDMAESINELLLFLEGMKIKLSSKEDSKEILDKIDDTIHAIGESKNHLEKLTSDDLKKMNDDIKELAKSMFSMLDDEIIEEIND